jgi:hypothetical protein
LKFLFILFFTSLSYSSGPKTEILDYRNKFSAAKADLGLLERENGTLRCLFRSIYYKDEIENIAFTFEVNRWRRTLELTFKGAKEVYSVIDNEFRFQNTILRFSPPNTVIIESSYFPTEEDVARDVLDSVCRDPAGSGPLLDSKCFLDDSAISGYPYLRGYLYCKTN